MLWVSMCCALTPLAQGGPAPFLAIPSSSSSAGRLAICYC